MSTLQLAPSVLLQALRGANPNELAAAAADTAEIRATLTALSELSSALDVRLAALVGAEASSGSGADPADADAQERFAAFYSQSIKKLRSNEIQDQDVGDNMASRSITSVFAIGPNQCKVEFTLSNEDIGGDQKIDITLSRAGRFVWGYEQDGPESGDFQIDLEMAATLREESGVAAVDSRPVSYFVRDITGVMRQRLVELYGQEDSCGVSFPLNSSLLPRELELDEIDYD
eukprot:TRINITY_DN9534_c0_g1_i1.p1 TRINITY_DN9534_c0_g1~~TRINITY_DN9534_c0_g1_i1.p1  ORF type:complete len:231 (-),score=95.24 TRINITY_DN9534_c0_g1_i1:418-1110(-)